MDDKLRKKAAKIFNEAAKYIQKYGWQEKGMGKHGSPRCSMGALASAHRVKTWDKNLSNLMYKKLYEQLDGITLTEFNAKYRDGKKVAKLFQKTALKLVN